MAVGSVLQPTLSNLQAVMESECVGLMLHALDLPFLHLWLRSPLDLPSFDIPRQQWIGCETRWWVDSAIREGGSRKTDERRAAERERVLTELSSWIAHIFMS